MSKVAMKDLPYHNGIVMRAFPSDEQLTMIKKNSGCQRYVYNVRIARGKRLYELKQLGVRTYEQQLEMDELSKGITDKELKQTQDFLLESCIDSLAVMNGRRFYDQAWHNFSKNKGHFGVPGFHKKRPYYHVYQTNNQYGKDAKRDLYSGSARFVNKNTIKIPKIGKLRVSGSQARYLQMNQDIQIGTVTVRIEPSGCVYVSFALGSVKPFNKLQKQAHKTEGIDLNTSIFLKTSDDKTVDNPRFYRKAQKKLARQQQVLSRRQNRAKKDGVPLKERKHYQEQRRKVARLHARIKHQRQNFLQTESTELIKNHDLLVLEDLRSSNMMKNRRMAKSIADVGWRTFITLLEQKGPINNCEVITVSPRYTTQTCSACGYCKDKDSKGGKQTLAGDSINKKHERYECFECGNVIDRDLNAAKNILAKGLEKRRSLQEKATQQ